MSGYASFCQEVYSTDHVWFLLKPVTQADFNRALDKALANLEQAAGKQLGVMVDGSIVLIQPSSILYIESRLRKACIHTTDGVFETYLSLAKVEERLPRGFVRCHKSFLVNVEHASKLERDRIVLFNGGHVPVSQRHRKSTREVFMSYLIDA